MQRGKCTFKEKILKAAAFNASAVIIYNNSTKEDTVTMAHEGQSDTVKYCAYWNPSASAVTVALQPCYAICCAICCYKAVKVDLCLVDPRGMETRHWKKPGSSSAEYGTGDIVAVMITESFGKEILGFLEKNQTVLVSVMVGSRGLPKNINRGSLVFVSISFIVLMIISSAWLIFYFIQKIRDTSARDRSQRRLGDAAKKAISKLTTRTVKRGDKARLCPCRVRQAIETEPDFNHCAVCIEGYQLNDVVRILPCKHIFVADHEPQWLACAENLPDEEDFRYREPRVFPGVNTAQIVRQPDMRRRRRDSKALCESSCCSFEVHQLLAFNLPISLSSLWLHVFHKIQTSSQRTALVDLSSETSISLEPLRHSSSSQLPSDEELIPRTGEINIAFRSRVLCLVCDRRLSMVSSPVPRIREVLLFSSRLHLSPVSSSLRLSVEMIPWPRPQQKMTPPPFTLLTEEWFIVASFGVLSALTLCYMIIRATASTSNYDLRYIQVVISSTVILCLRGAWSVRWSFQTSKRRWTCTTTTNPEDTHLLHLKPIPPSSSPQPQTVGNNLYECEMEY
ncbi:E3 ubiquitin-protein ligase RNF130 [Labeo rohita]|uniref:E3 ubiquitin-protein ligase RNF130 n=2 Tax=Labeonini TaxID=2743697 RepID=A0ABQ8M2X9_LABRO|nr:E3 ubiquitin-protein ligase RNF130 [Labeo rohita]